MQVDANSSGSAPLSQSNINPFSNRSDGILSLTSEQNSNTASTSTAPPQYSAPMPLVAASTSTMLVDQQPSSSAGQVGERSPAPDLDQITPTLPMNPTLNEGKIAAPTRIVEEIQSKLSLVPTRGKGELSLLSVMPNFFVGKSRMASVVMHEGSYFPLLVLRRNSPMTGMSHSLFIICNKKSSDILDSVCALVCNHEGFNDTWLKNVAIREIPADSPSAFVDRLAKVLDLYFKSVDLTVIMKKMSK